MNLRAWCDAGGDCHGAGVRAGLQVLRGYMLALAESSRHCVLRILCNAAARAAAEGAVGVLAATLARLVFLN